MPARTAAIMLATRVIFYRASLRRQKVPLPERLPRVDLIPMYAGADGGYVRHAAYTAAEAMSSIKDAAGNGVPVIIATKVYNGRTFPLYGFIGGGKTLQEAGAAFAGDLSGDKARILTMLVLPTTKDRKKLQAHFER